MTREAVNKLPVSWDGINPFATRFTRPGAIRFRSRTSAIEAWVKQLLRWKMVQIVGPHGSGKTTLAVTLARELQRRGVPVRLVQAWSARSIGCRFYGSGNSSGAILFMDGFGKLNWLTRLSLRRYCRKRRITLVAIVHRRLRGVPLLFKTNPNADEFVELSHWLQRNLSRPLVSAALAEATWVRHGGDYREAFMDLYDHCQGFLQDSVSAA